MISVQQTIINLVQVTLDKIPFISLDYVSPQAVLKHGYNDYSPSPDKETKVPDTKWFAQGDIVSAEVRSASNFISRNVMLSIALQNVS